jgi:hypothetical protein
LGAGSRNPTLNLFIYPKYCVGLRRELGLFVKNQKNHHSQGTTIPALEILDGE